MKFNEILKNLREDRGYTQRELAKVLNVTKSSICHYEQEISMPSIDVLIGMAKVFDVTLDYLLGRTEFNLPDTRLKKAFGNRKSVGELLEMLIMLDNSHRADLMKVLYYIQADNNNPKRTKR